MPTQQRSAIDFIYSGIDKSQTQTQLAGRNFNKELQHPRGHMSMMSRKGVLSRHVAETYGWCLLYVPNSAKPHGRIWVRNAFQTAFECSGDNIACVQRSTL